MQKLNLMLALLLATVHLGRSGYTGWEVQNDPVIELDAKTFGEALSGPKSLWLVDFYAPWCAHCKQLAPEWTAAAQRLAKEIPDEVKLAAVDCTANQVLCDTYEVSGYPTIIAVENGEPVELPEYRMAAEILTYVRQKLGFPWERAEHNEENSAGSPAVSAGTSLEGKPTQVEDPGILKTFRGLPESVFFKDAFCADEGAAKLDGKHAVTAVIDTVEGCIDFCSHRDGAGAAVYHAKGETCCESVSALATQRLMLTSLLAARRDREKTAMQLPSRQTVRCRSQTVRYCA